MPTNLTRAEVQRRIIIAQAELRARGKVLEPAEIKKSPWTTDPSGYYPRSDGRLFNPQGEQSDFIHTSVRFSALIGGRGSGKSASGAQRAIARIEAGESGAVFAPDFEQFRTSTWPELSQWIPWHKVIPSQQGRRLPNFDPRGGFTLVFVNGAKMMCKGLKDPDSARGPNINWLWYDEGGRDRTGMGWNIAIAGVRISRYPHNAPAAWVTTTPKGKNHWLYKLFVKKEFPKEAIEALRDSGYEGEVSKDYYVSIHDNQPNLDPMYYATMLAAYGEGWFANQELSGIFVDSVGSLVDRKWFTDNIITRRTYDLNFSRNIVKRVRYWDLAATEKEQATDDPDFTAGCLASYHDGKWFIEDIIAKQYRWADIKELIVATAKADGMWTPIVFEQEPGGAGKNLIAEIQSWPELDGYDVTGHRPEGDKVVRANPWFGQAKLGNIYIVADGGEETTWVKEFLNEVESFPGTHDDRVDSVSGATLKLGLTFNMADLLASGKLNIPVERTRWQVGVSSEEAIRKGRRTEELVTNPYDRWRVG